MEFYDVHTHQIYSEDNDDPYHSCIFDVYSLEFEVAKELHQRHSFSCGVHPWYSEDSETQMTYLTEITSSPRIVAIGETGLDKLKGPSFNVQTPVFKKHIEISEKLEKPVIIHCVKAWEELLKIKKETSPKQPWIIHGYRGKPDLTKRLLNEGFYFSVGENINVESMQLIPIDRLFCETDEGDITIREVYQQAAQSLNIDMIDFADRVAQNVRKMFPSLQAPKPYYPKFEEED
ncbi:MAG TPA: TatD family hydrolase [Fermentimonas sp.]|nr:TatD family hydrolase [Fermentimonas sp.]